MPQLLEAKHAHDERVAEASQPWSQPGKQA
jgi:hypothetical protein